MEVEKVQGRKIERHNSNEEMQDTKMKKRRNNTFKEENRE